MIKLFIDDERFPPNDGCEWVIVRSCIEAEIYIRNNGCPVHISFDHDLGDGVGTGFDVVKFMIEAHLDNVITIPDNFTFYVHSQNPVGKANIESLLSSFLEHIKVSEYE